MPRARKVKPLGRDAAAKKLARWVNENHDGNITAAATAIGCDYDQLYSTVKGMRSRGPSLALLLLLAKHTGTTIESWISEDSRGFS
jgi:hypothetical protein